MGWAYPGSSSSMYSSISPFETSFRFRSRSSELCTSHFLLKKLFLWEILERVLFVSCDWLSKWITNLSIWIIIVLNLFVWAEDFATIVAIENELKNGNTNENISNHNFLFIHISCEPPRCRTIRRSAASCALMNWVQVTAWRGVYYAAPSHRKRINEIRGKGGEG